MVLWSQIKCGIVQMLLISKLCVLLPPGPLINDILPGYCVALQQTCHKLLPSKKSGLERRNRSVVRKGPLYFTEGDLKITAGPQLESHWEYWFRWGIGEIHLPFPNNCVKHLALLPIFPLTWKAWSGARERGCCLQNLCRFIQLALALQNPERWGMQGAEGSVGCLRCAMWCTSVLKSLTSCCKLLSAHPHLTCEHKNSHVPGILMVFPLLLCLGINVLKMQFFQLNP